MTENTDTLSPVLADLKAKALKATPGEWTNTSARPIKLARAEGFHEARVHVGAPSNFGNAIATIGMGGRGATDRSAEAVDGNAAFIAAANPSVVSALITALEEAEGRMTQIAGNDIWWKTVIGETHPPSEAGISVRHLHPLTVKPIYEAYRGGAVGDVIAGLIFEAAITRNREQFLVSDALDRARSAEVRAEKAEQALTALQQENERLRDKLLEVENDVMAKAQDIYIGEVYARQAAESAIPIAFKAGWEATKTGNFHVDGGRETACKMFLDGFDFADEDGGEDLSIPQKPLSFQGAVERGAEAVWRARYAHAIGKARPTPWLEAADSQRTAILVEADACIRAALLASPPSGVEIKPVTMLVGQDWLSRHAATDPDTSVEAGPDVLAWLSENRNVELSFDYGDADDDGKGWCVHRVNGGVNDREWTLIGTGETPLSALRAALQRKGEAG